MPDGRNRRTELLKKQLNPTKYQHLADAAKALWDERHADIQIAERLGCSPPAAVAAVNFWHASRGLPMPSHEERRRDLVDRMLALYQGNALIQEIAAQVRLNPRTVTLLLRKRFASLGQQMPDG